MLALPDETQKWTLLDKGYKVTSFSSTYGAVPQRWLLVFSQQAYTREMATLQPTFRTLFIFDYEYYIKIGQFE
ncbi:hypothetical protein [Cardinium endosymbiont of Tipula unca]|uniref:hypothetical protein n=1 Tax=Cardinium endosymbiont of Tipula unca TaxID=3066216 RepID=UPI0030D2C3DF